MEVTTINAVVALVAGMIGASITATFNYIVHVDLKKRNKLEQSLKTCQADILARQAEENVAAEWLVELGAFRSPIVAKKELRRRTQQRHGKKPFMTPTKAEQLI